jgi:hypothetical protein
MWRQSAVLHPAPASLYAMLVKISIHSQILLMMYIHQTLEESSFQKACLKGAVNDSPAKEISSTSCPINAGIIPPEARYSARRPGSREVLDRQRSSFLLALLITAYDHYWFSKGATRRQFVTTTKDRNAKLDRSGTWCGWTWAGDVSPSPD